MMGRIQSLQSLGAVDGPGVRFVVFLQGCPLRCIYCHNPDTWAYTGGTEVETGELVKQILRYRPYFKDGGGVTVSGGEPLLQAAFVRELFQQLQAEGIHTALDTAGIAAIDKARQVLAFTDLVLADLKFATRQEYNDYCGGDFTAVQAFLKLTEEMQIPLWIRHVIVPGINDNREDAEKIKQIAGGYSNLERIEWLPFHNMCLEKYQRLGLEFPLKDTPALPEETLRQIVGTSPA